MPDNDEFDSILNGEGISPSSQSTLNDGLAFETRGITSSVFSRTQNNGLTYATENTLSVKQSSNPKE